MAINPQNLGQILAQQQQAQQAKDRQALKAAPTETNFGNASNPIGLISSGFNVMGNSLNAGNVRAGQQQNLDRTNAIRLESQKYNRSIASDEVEYGKAQDVLTQDNKNRRLDMEEKSNSISNALTLQQQDVLTAQTKDKAEYDAAQSKYAETFGQFSSKKKLRQSIENDKSLNVAEQDRLSSELMGRWDRQFGVSDQTTQLMGEMDEQYNAERDEEYRKTENNIRGYVQDELGINPDILEVGKGEVYDSLEAVQAWETGDRSGVDAAPAINLIYKEYPGASKNLVNYIMTQAQTSSFSFGMSSEYDVYPSDVKKQLKRYKEELKVVNGDDSYNTLQSKLKQVQQSDKTSRRNYNSKQAILAQSNAYQAGLGNPVAKPITPQRNNNYNSTTLQEVNSLAGVRSPKTNPVPERSIAGYR